MSEKNGKGHLIVHGITLEESKALTGMLGKKADWWPKEELAKLDEAAGFAMLTHGYEKTDDKKIIKLGL